MDYELLSTVLMCVGVIVVLFGLIVDTQEIISSGLSAMIVGLCIIITMLVEASL